MNSERLQVAIFGDGPAGLSSARELAQNGHEVHLIAPDTKKFAHSVYTTDRMLPKEMSDAFFTKDQTLILPYLRVITSNGTDFRVTAQGNYFMVNYPKLVEAAKAELERMPNVFISALPPSILKDVKINDLESEAVVIIDGQTLNFNAIIDATGVHARIDRQVNKNREKDYLVEYIYGATIRGKLENSEMILVIGPAAGTSWVNPNIDDKNNIDVVFSAYGPKSQYSKFLNSAKPRLNELISFIAEKPGVHVYSKNPENTYAGFIRAQTTKKPNTYRVYTVGEAAGMAKPSSGDSIQRAIMSGRILCESLKKGQSPSEFHKKWNREWPGQELYFAGTIVRLRYQEKGELGGILDAISKWMKNSNGTLTEQVEKYVIDGKLSPGLVARILTTPKVASLLFLAAAKKLELSFKDAELPDHLPLPKS